MYCPYRTVLKQETETRHVGEKETTIVSETIDFRPCYEDECAMWQDGQCWKR